MEIDLSWLCVPLGFGLMLIFIVLGARSRLLYAKRIRAAQARGAFDDFRDPKQQRKFRWRAFMAIIGLVGMVGIVIVYFLQLAGVIMVNPKTFLVAFGIFGSLSVIGGILMQGEINRRL